jgi:HEPN domain-containing protein
LNPKEGKRANPKHLFTSAEYFNAAADELHQARIRKNGFWLHVPRIVLASFATELYLKTLLADLIGVIAKTHDPAELFRNLPRPTREILKKRHKVLSEEEYPIRPSLAVSPDITDLEVVLDLSRNTFVKYRYIYDPLVEGRAGFHLDVCIKCLREFILKRHPDWRNGSWR